MIIVSTTSAPDARFMIGLLRVTPPGVSFRVYLAGHKVASRPPLSADVTVTDTRRWPQLEPAAPEPA